MTSYLEALKREISLRLRKENSVATIYFGGGTPSLLSLRQVEDLLSYLKKHCTLEKDAEVTLEVNPGTISKDYLEGLRGLGINRISLGAQSFNEGELKTLGRTHTAEEASEAFNNARKAGFNNISIDLIYGLPLQKIGSWQKSLESAVKLNPEHISLYALTLEEDTPLMKKIENGDLPNISEDALASAYEEAEKVLGDAGYEHYEISNWAKKGYECRHNLTYWQGGDYLGFGVAAHSYLGGVRQGNIEDIDKYEEALLKGELPPRSVNEVITEEMQIAEEIILGLRLSKGVDLKDFEKRRSIDIIESYSKQLKELRKYKLINWREDKIYLTAKGRLLGNEVFCRFLP